ncbi:MAG: fucose isomerase [Eubacteriales bacterium]|nr:fucose isomerase [Eubacteriales bacterium]
MSTFGVIVTTRGFFPGELAETARKQILEKLKGMGHEAIILPEHETRYGAIESYEDSKKLAKLFSDNRDKIEGIIVILPNFGDEIAVATTIDLAKLDVPVLVQACDDDLDKDNRMPIETRRDAFCGKLSVCNNFRQRGISFTDTTYHTCAIESEVFTKDLERFNKICKVVNGLKNARLGSLGARPFPFHTVRYSEKLLQAYGITTCVVDMSDIISATNKMETTDEVKERVMALKAYANIPSYIKEERIVLQAKLCLTIEKWLKGNECAAGAVQCWSSIEDSIGCGACLSMSYLGENGLPCACESDVMGALSMYALYLASDQPSGYLDWNNNYKENRDMCINTHCSSLPRGFFGHKFEASNLDILGKSLGEENCFGACKGKVDAGPMTFAKISTDEVEGVIKCYIGEGEFTDDPAVMDGGIVVCKIPELQDLMKFLCKEGFEHHVAMSRSLSADILEEAFANYLGWEVYRHN